MAILDYYVDPDAGGANDGGGDGAANDPTDEDNWTDAWTSLNTAEAALDNPYDGNRAIIYCRSGSGTADTAAVAFSGATFAAASDYMTVVVAAGNRHDGKYNATKYRIEPGNATCMDIAIDYLRIDGLQFFIANTSDTFKRGIYLADGGVGAASDVRITNNVFKMTDSATSVKQTALQLVDLDQVVKIWNIVMYDFTLRGLNAKGTTDVYNSVACNCAVGFYEGAGTVSAYNCASFNNADDFANLTAIDYCASDDGDGTNAVDISPGGVEADGWNAAVVDYSNGDFHVKDASSVLYDAADATAPGGLFTDDIDGDTRSQWDIGADEFVAVGGVAPTGALQGPLVGSLGGPI